jgi:hypothetical protein
MSLGDVFSRIEREAFPETVRLKHRIGRRHGRRMHLPRATIRPGPMASEIAIDVPGR